MSPRPGLAFGLRSFTLFASIASIASIVACDKPAPPLATERRPLIASAEAPLLNEAEDDEAATDIGRTGEVVELVKELGTLKWEAPMGDKIGKRDGRLIEVRQAPNDAILFGWKDDLGPEVDVPTTAAICEAIARDPALPPAAKLPTCAGLLRRVRLPDGAFAAYQVCSVGPCPVAVVRGGRVSAITVEGMVKARMLAAQAGPVLLASTRWARSGGAWTGGALVPIKLWGGAPIALPAIPLDEVDARDRVKVVARSVRPILEDQGGPTGRLAVHLVGELRETALADGRELATTPIDVTVPIGDR